MRVPSELYRPPLALFTDFYELTMAYAAWKSGVAGREAVFNISFRRGPFQGGFAVAAGLDLAIDFVTGHRFDPGDLAYLAEQRGADGARPFEPGFLDYLSGLPLECDPV